MKSFTWPVGPEFPITQYFGTNPGGANPAGGHTGMDFATPAGTPIYAPGDGKILLADWVDDTWQDNLLWLRGGISVVLDCGDTEPTFVFGHLSRTDRNAGDWVRQGDIIGYTGNTGYSSGPHLHFEALLPGYVLGSPTLGRSDPRKVCSGYWTGKPAAVVPAGSTTSSPGTATRTVTTQGANARTLPFSTAPKAVGYPDGFDLGAKIAVVGYVKGEAVTPGNDAWYKTVSGLYMWANAAGDDIGGLAYLGDMSGQKPAPPQAPAPAPAPAPQPTPAPAAYDFALDFATITREDGVVIRVEKRPAAEGNFARGNGPTVNAVVIHQMGTPGVDTIVSTTNTFQKPGAEVSAHWGVSGRTVYQYVAMSDRAYHAAGGNDMWGIETDPYQDEETVKTVRALLLAIDARRKVKLTLLLHRNVVGSRTSCGSLVDLARYDVVYPPAAPAPAPAPSLDEESVIRKFLGRVTEWLIATFVKAQK